MDKDAMLEYLEDNEESLQEMSDTTDEDHKKIMEFVKNILTSPEITVN